MCAILDTCVAHEVFSRGGSGPTTEAGREFFQWLQDGKGKLVIGGKLRGELLRVSQFSRWATEALRTGGGNGKLMVVDDQCIEDEAQEIERCNDLRSNDSHIIALAQVSGARLLFSKDRKLIKDFENPDIINNPPGEIYSDTTVDKRSLLEKYRCRPGN